jgi:hypothetical protein
LIGDLNHAQMVTRIYQANMATASAQNCPMRLSKVGAIFLSLKETFAEFGAP